VVRRIVESQGTEPVTVLDHQRYYRDRNDLRFEELPALNDDHRARSRRAAVDLLLSLIRSVTAA
jgi:hypothetical protein